MGLFFHPYRHDETVDMPLPEKIESPTIPIRRFDNESEEPACW